ncbi:uncharacterized protein [Physcomitrium patens]|uniref:uncharacterized protein isoform X1 n=1 Tax=Physcomitrium patens TaxID=3218 RepID=UPI003CCE1A6D
MLDAPALVGALSQALSVLYLGAAFGAIRRILHSPCRLPLPLPLLLLAAANPLSYENPERFLPSFLRVSKNFQEVGCEVLSRLGPPTTRHPAFLFACLASFHCVLERHLHSVLEISVYWNSKL